MPVLARFDGDPNQLQQAYDQASSSLEQQTGSALPPGALRHTCALAENALFVVDVWESEAALRAVIESDQFQQALTGAGFPSPKEADIQVLQVHAAIPPL